MYNNTRYSLARYSVKEREINLAVEACFAETVGSLAGAAVPVDIRETYAEACRGTARGTVSLITLLTVGDGLLASIRMSADVRTGAVLSEVFLGRALCLKNTPAGLEGGETLSAALRGSKNLHTVLKLGDGLRALAAGSKDIHAAPAFSEVLTSMGEATSQTTRRASFQLTIPPGGELRIDSGLFLVLLNGENALHTQSGDWVDVSRELLRLTIESASGGGLEGQLIYTERFL